MSRDLATCPEPALLGEGAVSRLQGLGHVAEGEPRRVTDENVEPAFGPRKRQGPGKVADVVGPHMVAAGVVEATELLEHRLDRRAVEAFTDTVSPKQPFDPGRLRVGSPLGCARGEGGHKAVEACWLFYYALGEIKFLGEELKAVGGVDRDPTLARGGCRLAPTARCRRGGQGWSARRGLRDARA